MAKKVKASVSSKVDRKPQIKLALHAAGVVAFGTLFFYGFNYARTFADRHGTTPAGPSEGRVSRSARLDE